MSNHLTPVAVCERLIAPIEDLALIAGRTGKAAYGWRRDATGRAAGDFPSATIMRRLLSYSDARGLGVQPKHLIFGASEDEIASILAARDIKGAA